LNESALLSALATSILVKLTEEIFKLRMKEKEMSELINEFLEYQRIWQIMAFLL